MPSDEGDWAPELLSGRSTSIAEIRQKLRTGERTAEGLVSACLQRAEEVGSTVNAVVTPNERALDQARACDEAARNGTLLGPLHGIPFTVKDIIATAGLRTTAGSQLLHDHVPDYTAPAVQRLIDHGAVLVGKSNCPEFGLAMHTANRVFGDTFNPLDLRRSSGGSSGGDSAAVASGCAVFGVGTDYGGSIRWPAHCVGAASLRPSPGLVPRSGQVPYPFASTLESPSAATLQGRLQTIAPLARTVRDAWAVLNVMRGIHPTDPETIPWHPRRPDQPEPTALRGAWFIDDGHRFVDAGVAAAIVNAVETLERAGIGMSPTSPAGFGEASELFDEIRAEEGQETFVAESVDRRLDLSDPIAGLVDSASRYRHSNPRWKKLLTTREQLRMSVAEFFQRYDFMVVPVASTEAHDPSRQTVLVDGHERPNMWITGWCRAITLLQLPVAVVSVGTGREGLPVAVQVVGRPYEDDVAATVAMTLEGLVDER